MTLLNNFVAQIETAAAYLTILLMKTDIGGYDLKHGSLAHQLVANFLNILERFSLPQNDRCKVISWPIKS